MYNVLSTSYTRGIEPVTFLLTRCWLYPLATATTCILSFYVVLMHFVLLSFGMYVNILNNICCCTEIIHPIIHPSIWLNIPSSTNDLKFSGSSCLNVHISQMCCGPVVPWSIVSQKSIQSFSLCMMETLFKPREADKIYSNISYINDCYKVIFIIINNSSWSKRWSIT